MADPVEQPFDDVVSSQVVHLYKRAETEKKNSKFEMKRGIADLMSLDHRIRDAFRELTACARYCTQRRNHCTLSKLPH